MEIIGRLLVFLFFLGVESSRPGSFLSLFEVPHTRCLTPSRGGAEFLKNPSAWNRRKAWIGGHFLDRCHLQLFCQRGFLQLVFCSPFHCFYGRDLPRCRWQGYSLYPLEGEAVVGPVAWPATSQAVFPTLTVFLWLFTWHPFEGRCHEPGTTGSLAPAPVPLSPVSPCGSSSFPLPQPRSSSVLRHLDRSPPYRSEIGRAHV